MFRIKCPSFVLLFSLLIFLPFLPIAAKANIADTLSTSAGLISGATAQDGEIRVFKGIPFAAPPVGELRWKAPQPMKPWKGVKSCISFGPSPMQASPTPFSMWSEEFLIRKEPISEDCLYLNVWTGAKSGAEAKRPVIVWIYGGGFASGGSNVPIYDGEAMAKKGVVFVSFNYRVGVFGFFAHPELTKEAPYHSSGNYGLLDQIAALRWVKQNISAFGGDPQNVTIAGQSAGAMSVNCLVASPLAKGLFDKAIAESGASFTGTPFVLQEAEQAGLDAAQLLNASSIADLRSQPAALLLEKVQGMHRPIVDGYVLPKSIAAIFAEGQENRVALLTGWNEDEGLMTGPVKGAGQFRADVERQYGNDAPRFLAYYPASSDVQAAKSQLDLSRDLIFGMQNYTWANLQSRLGSFPVFVYRFARKVPASGEYIKYGAFHTGEVPYAYDNLKFVNRPWQPVDRQLANVMSTYWVNFAKTGNPNGTGLPKWPAYSEKDKRVMVFDVKSASKRLDDSEALDFLYKTSTAK